MSAVALEPELSPATRDYLHQAFELLGRVPSPAGDELACRDIVAGELSSLGLRILEDAPVAGSRCGNMIASLPARAHPLAPDGGLDGFDRGAGDRSSRASSLLFVAHLDTGPSEAAARGGGGLSPGGHARARVDPLGEAAARGGDGLSRGGHVRARVDPLGDAGARGGDGLSPGGHARARVGVAVLLALAHHLSETGSSVEVELLFTVGSHSGLAGAHALDVSLLRSPFGYVLDREGPIGELVVSSPTQFLVEASFHGVAADAARRPREGRSAILAAAHAIAELGLEGNDEQTSVNVGTVAGGGSSALVPDHCSLLAEVRSSSDERAEATVAELVDRLHDTANRPECDCDLDVSVQRTLTALTLAPAAPAVQVAERALERCGHEPLRVAGGEASDAHALLAKGLTAVSLAVGTWEAGAANGPEALEQVLALSLALLTETARRSPGESR